MYEHIGSIYELFHKLDSVKQVDADYPIRSEDRVYNYLLAPSRIKA